MTSWSARARAILQTESEAIAAAAGRLGPEFDAAVARLLELPGKVIVSGLGKSGLIARKIAATLASTGTPATYLHPADAQHGDLGNCLPGDAALLLSQSGSTAEILRLLPAFRELGLPVVAITGRRDSVLAQQAHFTLDSSVAREADSAGLIPTASAAVMLALGDALALALMEARGFAPDDFGRLHPGGQLGRNLRATVREAMHTGSEVAWINPATTFRELVIALTRHPLGAACVVDAEQRLLGLVTDGDLRRALQRELQEFAALTAAQILTPRPVTIAPTSTLGEALRLMEDRPSQISVLPVVDPESGRCEGLLRIHDIFALR